MYPVGADEYADEDARRKASAQGPNFSAPDQGANPYAPPQRPADDPYYTQPLQPGILAPETGYGWGGVENPAYGQSMTAATEIQNQPKPTTPPPAFQAPQQAAPSSYTPSGTTHFATTASQPSTRTPPITDEVTRILMARLNELKNPGDVQSDPIYQQAVRAYQMGELRSAGRQQKALAERSAAGGTRSSGGFNVGVRGIQERSGENTSRFAAGTALDRLQAREAQLNEAIKMARAVGQDDIANQLEVQRLQLQAELGRGDLALRGELGRGQLGLGYDQLGLSYADLVSRANRDAVLAGLGG
jgi:hypothetical protein